MSALPVLQSINQSIEITVKTDKEERLAIWGCHLYTSTSKYINNHDILWENVNIGILISIAVDLFSKITNQNSPKDY